MASERQPRHPVGPPVAAALGLLVAALLSCGRPEPERYNLVVVLSDALRAPNLAFHGYPRQTAPRLEELAAESVVFERHLAHSPGTPVSVSQMMTGRLMAPLLMRPAMVRTAVRALEPDLLVLPAALRRAGLRTGIVSSHPWFAGSRLLDGFDEVVLPEPGPGEAYARFERLLPEALDFVDRALEGGGEPFFLYLHSMDTHGPFTFHPGFDRHRGAEGWPEVYNAYDSEIEYTDHGVGLLVDHLRRKGILERTVFVFTSDHGEELGEMGPEYWNRSHGYTVRRVQLHVPFLVRLPGGRLGGTVRAAPSEHLDVAPTLLRLAVPGADLAGYRLDGRDLGPDLVADGGADPGHRTVAFTWRFWGIYDGDLELHWDQWRDRPTLYRTDRVLFNYPMSVEIDEPAATRRLSAELARIRGRRIRELLRQPPEIPPPSVVVGTPTTLLAREGGAIPTYDRSLEDGRWLHDPAKRLEAGPGERPGPVRLGMVWAPGRYRVRARLDRARIEEGWASRFRIRFPLSDGEPVEVAGEDADGEGYVDLGSHEIGRYFAVEVSEPEGGVALLGFAFDRGPAAAGEAPRIDEDLRERLEALGYVD